MACTSAQELFQKGLAEEEKGDRAKAVEYYTAAIQTDKDFVKAYNNRALIHLQEKRLSEAESDLNEALRIQPTSASALINRGLLHEARGEFALALSSYDAALKSDPESSIALFNAAKTALQLGRPVEAAAHIDAAMKKTDNNPSVRRLAARIYLAAGRDKEARDLYKGFHDANTGDEEALGGLIQASRRIGRSDDALRYAELYSKERPNCVRCLTLLSSLYLENGRNETALTTLETGVRRFPDDPTLRYRLGLLYAGSGQSEKAIHQLEAYVKLRGDEADDEAEAAKTLLATMKKGKK